MRGPLDAVIRGDHLYVIDTNGVFVPLLSPTGKIWWERFKQTRNVVFELPRREARRVRLPTIR